MVWLSSTVFIYDVAICSLPCSKSKRLLLSEYSWSCYFLYISCDNFKLWTFFLPKLCIAADLFFLSDGLPEVRKANIRMEFHVYMNNKSNENAKSRLVWHTVCDLSIPHCNNIVPCAKNNRMNHFGITSSLLQAASVLTPVTAIRLFLLLAIVVSATCSRSALLCTNLNHFACYQTPDCKLIERQET